MAVARVEPDEMPLYAAKRELSLEIDEKNVICDYSELSCRLQTNNPMTLFCGSGTSGRKPTEQLVAGGFLLAYTSCGGGESRVELDVGGD